ncbi:MAG TPA: universal stress protein [Flavitalea sp.]|nr:universal stress protein [Flavitalea sp.]
MEKILLAIDATRINKTALDFACYIAELKRSQLTGIFLEKMQEEPSPVLKSPNGIPYVETVADGDIKETLTNKNIYDQNVRFFEETCRKKGIPSAKYHRRVAVTEDIIHESRFADLLIVDPQMSFSQSMEGRPSSLIKKILAKSECPVIITPDQFTGVDEILFAYDGSFSAVFAIKQFTYLFPELSDKKISILQVDEKEALSLTEQKKIAELAQMHYSSIGFHLLQGKPREELLTYILEKKNIFVVMGAFGRSMLSELFKPSAGEFIIKQINSPVFTAHL